MLQSPSDLGPSWQVIAGALVALVQVLAVAVGRAVQKDVADVKKGQEQLHETVIRIDTALFGAKGDNGLSSEVKELRKRQHALGNAMQRMPGYRHEDGA